MIEREPGAEGLQKPHLGRRALRYFTKAARAERAKRREEQAELWAKEWVDDSQKLSQKLRDSLEAHPTSPAVITFKGYDSKQAIFNYAELIYAHLMGRDKNGVIERAETNPSGFKAEDFGHIWESVSSDSHSGGISGFIAGPQGAEVLMPTNDLMPERESGVGDIRFVFVNGTKSQTSTGILIIRDPYCGANLDTVAGEAIEAQWEYDRKASVANFIAEG